MIGFPWTPEQIDWLRANYPDMRTDACIAHIGCTRKQLQYKVSSLKIKKSAAWMASDESPLLKAASARAKIVGSRGQFQPGAAPWNKGISYQAGGRSTETRFKPGAKPHTWHPIGHTSTAPDGYLYRKTQDTGVTRRDYVLVHHLIWRMHGRSVPKGHVLVFRDGEKSNVDINNLELIPRGELMKRNSVHRHGPEIAQISQLIGCINRQLRKKEDSQNAQP